MKLWRNRTIAVAGTMLLLLLACGPAAEGVTPTPTLPTPTRAATATPATATPATATPATATPATATPATAPTTVKPKYGGTARLVRRDDMPGWDPHRLKGGFETLRTETNLVFSLLGSYLPTPENRCSPKLRPEALEGWSWLNDTTLRIKLRPGVKFANKPPLNGRAVTIEDVRYSLNRALFSAPMKNTEVILPYLKGLEVTGPDTLDIKVTAPVADLVSMALGNYHGSVILPRELAGPDDGWDTPQQYIGSGPFTVASWQPGIKIINERNPNYWKEGLPYLDRLESVIMLDLATRTAAMISGKIDLWIRDIPYPSLDPLKAAGVTLQECPALKNFWLLMNASKPPFNDVRVRRAAALAIDQQALLQAILRGRGALGGVEPALDEHYLAYKDYPPEAAKYLKHDLSEAKRLLAEAGYKGEKVLINTLAGGWPRDQFAEASDAMLRQAGFNTYFNLQSTAVYNAQTVKGNYEGIAVTGQTAWPPSATLTKLHSGNDFQANRSHTTDPVLDKYIDEYLVSGDAARAKELAHKIQARIVEQAHLIPLAQQLEFATSQPWIRNFAFHSQDQFSGTWVEVVWLDK